MDAQEILVTLRSAAAGMTQGQKIEPTALLKALDKWEAEPSHRQAAKAGEPFDADGTALSALIHIAHALCSSCNKLTGWLLTVMGGALALIISNFESTKDILDPSSLSLAIKLYVGVFALHLLQRVLTIFVDSAATGLAFGLEQKVKPSTPGEAFALLDAMSKPFPFPLSVLMKRSMDRLKSGDRLHMGYRITRVSLVVAVLSALQMGVAGYAIWQIARGLS